MRGGSPLRKTMRAVSTGGQPAFTQGTSLMTMGASGGKVQNRLHPVADLIEGERRDVLFACRRDRHLADAAAPFSVVMQFMNP